MTGRTLMRRRIPENRLIDHGPALDAAGLVHRVHVPDSGVPRPVVVMLHGRYGDEEDMWIFARTVPRDWVVVAPRGIVEERARGYAWLQRERDDWPALDEFEQPVEAVVGLIGALPELYGADRERVLLLGFSQGAATAYAVALLNAGLACAVAGLVGFLPTGVCHSEGVASLASFPILMVVGRHDPLIPLSKARECAKGLEAAGAELTYREHDTGHKLNREGFEDLERWWHEVESGWSGDGLPGDQADHSRSG